MDQREYGRDREREMFRERPPLDYERDRLERERYSRDERCDALGMHFYSVLSLSGSVSSFLFVLM